MFKVIFFLNLNDKQNSFRLLLGRVPQKDDNHITFYTPSGKTFKGEVVEVHPQFGHGGERYHILIRNPLAGQEYRDFMAGWENMTVNHQSF